MKQILVMIIACLLLGVTGVSADEFNKGASLSSTDFRILDPQHAAFGAVSSSSSGSFRLLGAIGDVAIGSSSAATVKLRSGFLYFPLILAPALNTPTAGNTQVSLSWSTGMAQAGLTIGGYNLCTKPPSSSYACEDIGLVTSFTKTGLTNGSLYTFKVELRDARGNAIAVSGEKTATPAGVATPTPIPAPGGGGGGGGGGGPPGGTGTLELHGLAYPFATVHILRNGLEVGTTPANSAAEFSITIQVPAGNATIGFWAQSVPGNRSVMWPFAVNVTAGTTGRITGLIIPPTLVVSAQSVTPGATVQVHGDSAPGATVLIDVAGGQQASVLADAQGVWNYTLSTVGLATSVHDIKARTTLPPAADMSTWSQLIPLGVGVQVPGLPSTGSCGHPPDINKDTRIDLVDFSVLAFWWHRIIGADAVYDLNCDNQVSLADFSILAYYWTGR